MDGLHAVDHIYIHNFAVFSGASAVNGRGNTSENQADTIVVHSDLIGEL